MKKPQLLLRLFILAFLTALSPISAHACHRADCDVEDHELVPALDRYQEAKRAFYAQVNQWVNSGDEYDRRRAQMLLTEMPGIIRSNEKLAEQKCEAVSRLIGNGKQSNIAEFSCQMDEMKGTEDYLRKVLSTFQSLEY
jgi:hypothetical protein